MLGSCIMSRINMHYFMHISVKSIRFRCMIRKHISLGLLQYVTHKYALFDAYFRKMNALRTHIFETFECSIRVFVKHKYVSLLRRLKVTDILASAYVLGTCYIRRTPYLEPITRNATFRVTFLPQFQCFLSKVLPMSAM